ncbi:(S)-coclaurine N-methyltransferase [Aplysia californica]|uniref:(S)-coclaurine N-methyltransferase n=1 Tax=Aplysia californica TaxID=6500 RepID=A0ABM0JJZ3_APLCA|nr:(S)-coclaurine N-methyltransferase [Aplysia californica]
MAVSDETLRDGVRQNMSAWIHKLECGGDIEKQHNFKKKFIQRLRTSPIATDTDKANEQHYEVPTEFFLTVLGKRLKYSGCIFSNPGTTLDEAEEFTLQQYCERAKVEDGHDVMDLGCGWGSFGLYVLEKYPKCKVTCVSNSNTQRAHIVRRAEEMGVVNRLEAITADANTFTTGNRYDRIVSIEMFEHMKNYESLFQRVSSWLKPSGLLFLQVLCHKSFPYAFDTKPGSDTEWMAKNFFTGGTMPSVDLFLYFQRDVTLLESWIINGQNYSRTLEAWLEKMDANKDKVAAIFEKAYGSKELEQKVFDWRLFFIFCSEVFGFKKGNEWHVSYHLFQKKNMSYL